MSEKLRPKIHQIDGLQILRAVAVVLVAWLHAGQQFSEDRIWRVDFGVFGIDIFFVISGFILSLLVLREKRLPGLAVSQRFMMRRIIRIYPLYWIFSAVVAGRMWVDHAPLPRDFLWCVPLFPFPSRLFIGFAWTLRFEVLFYLVMAAVMAITIRRALPLLAGVLVLLVACGVPFDLSHSHWVVLCNPILLEFVFGIVIAMMYGSLGRRRLAGGLALLAGILMALILATRSLPGVAQSAQMILLDTGVFQRVMTWGVAAALIVGGMVFWSPATHSRLGRLMVGAGSASYSAYLVSGFMVELVVRLLIRYSGHPQQAWPGIFLDQCAVVLAVMVVGWISYVLLEKPMLDWMHRRLA